MADKTEIIIDKLYDLTPGNPQNWPLKWRRLFLLTLPISAPIWVVTMLIWVALTIVASLGIIFFWSPCHWVKETWNK